MEILVLDNMHNFVWKEATYKNNRFVPTDDNGYYGDTSIYAVKNDNRKKTVICSHCGKEIKNTPAAIKAHQDMINKPNKCFECTSLRKYNGKALQHKYSLNEDGTYTETTKMQLQLVCHRDYWNSPDINDPRAKEVCKYKGCTTAKFNHIEDFWTKYPKAFDEFITIDRIIDVGYKSMYKWSDHISFELKGRGNLRACVNNNGICYELSFDYRRRNYDVRYSKKYDKVWVNYGGSWKDISYVDLSADTQEAIVKKLKALYK